MRYLLLLLSFNVYAVSDPIDPNLIPNYDVICTAPIVWDDPLQKPLDPNDITNYTLYMGTATGVYDPDRKVTSGLCSINIDATLLPDSTQFYAYTATTTNGLESNKSAEVSQVIKREYAAGAPTKVLIQKCTNCTIIIK